MFLNVLKSLIILTISGGAVIAQDNSDTQRTNKVTHYYVPLLENDPPNKRNCHSIEGVCKYISGGEKYIYNYTGEDAPNGSVFVEYAKRHSKLVSEAVCKHGKGYGIDTNCTHPCRSLAASTKHHRRGELLFFEELVGVECGSGKSAMIHDGYAFVNDTGSPRHFNRTGRFDFFWGDCNSFNNDAVCLDGNALKIDRELDGAEYRLIWSPHLPERNKDIMKSVEKSVREEASKREDGEAARNFRFEDFLEGNRHYKPFDAD
ncbi:hypothetical protein [Labrenzia sp. PHM005]|uniref:hypothetical protein n=1 Tax=Labrenzia sp. PHM005 TaxID=2590016 RepID=UPI001140132A|nr:hypothetical protein [Labrenzia sp. PHM005]QDG74419.1 hypothetical protein FJ695_00205 [Labrenzia sp. PHM005]